VRGASAIILIMTSNFAGLSSLEIRILARIRLSVTTSLIALAAEADPALIARGAKRNFTLCLAAPGAPPSYIVSEGGSFISYSGGASPPRGSVSLILCFMTARSCASVLAGGPGSPIPLFLGPGAFPALGFFRLAAARVPAILSAEGTEPEFRARLLSEAALRGLVEVGNADPALSARLAHVPDGTVSFEVGSAHRGKESSVPKGFDGTSQTAVPAFALGIAKRGRILTFSPEAPASPSVRLRFRDPEAACSVLGGSRQAAVALGAGEVSLSGYLPLVQGLFAVLDRLGDFLAVKVRVGDPTSEREYGVSMTTSPKSVNLPAGSFPAASIPTSSLSSVPIVQPAPAGLTRSCALFERAARVIPGGIYGSKSPGFLVPGSYPIYIERARGSRMWDADGNEYIDYLCGYGSQLVGYGNEAVDEATCSRIRSGDLLDQPAPLMIELAEKLVSRIEGTSWAVFVKNGTDATTLALSLSRVRTGKALALAAEGAYHGAANWCGTNPFPELAFERDRILTFPYGDEEALGRLFAEHRGQIACLFLTPYHHPTYKPQVLPGPSWHRTARRLCDEEGALLVMDDIRANFRLHEGGSHLRFGAKPDLWCMGKALANGQPISLLMGRGELMKAASSFFITGTYWTSAAPMAAAIACLDEMERLGGVKRLEELGNALRVGLEAAGSDYGFGARISGPPAIPFLTFDEDPMLYLNQRFGAAMARRGVFLHPHHNWFISLAHSEEDIGVTVERAREVFAAMREGRA